MKGRDECDEKCRKVSYHKKEREWERERKKKRKNNKDINYKHTKRKQIKQIKEERKCRLWWSSRGKTTGKLVVIKERERKGKTKQNMETKDKLHTIKTEIKQIEDKKEEINMMK